MHSALEQSHTGAAANADADEQQKQRQSRENCHGPVHVACRVALNSLDQISKKEKNHKSAYVCIVVCARVSVRAGVRACACPLSPLPSPLFPLPSPLSPPRTHTPQHQLQDVQKPRPHLLE